MNFVVINFVIRNFVIRKSYMPKEIRVPENQYVEYRRHSVKLDMEPSQVPAHPKTTVEEETSKTQRFLDCLPLVIFSLGVDLSSPQILVCIGAIPAVFCTGPIPV
jgi:hypothetical protein